MYEATIFYKTLSQMYLTMYEIGVVANQVYSAANDGLLPICFPGGVKSLKDFHMPSANECFRLLMNLSCFINAVSLTPSPVVQSYPLQFPGAGSPHRRQGSTQPSAS